jgi:hypothetical protein
MSGAASLGAAALLLASTACSGTSNTPTDIDMAAGPSYMLADVKDVQTPAPQTFVVTLTTPSHRSSTTWPHRMDR